MICHFLDHGVFLGAEGNMLGYEDMLDFGMVRLARRLFSFFFFIYPVRFG